MKKLKLWFTDFDQLFDPQDNFIYHLLSPHYDIQLDPNHPNYLIYSCYGTNFLNYNCVRIFYTGENLIPDFNLCDYGIGFAYLEFGDRYLRYPNFALYKNQFKELVTPGNFDNSAELTKEHFCNFVYANSSADPARDEFFRLLNEYKLVSSPGKHLNNTSMDIGERFSEDWMYSKIDFQSKCKFSIAFENTSSPGYTTEKILHAFISNTIPIYWGNPDVARDFNPESFINSHDFESFEDVIERVKIIDNDPEFYNAILREPPFRQNMIPENLKKETLLSFLQNILDKNPEEALKRPIYGTIAKYEKNIKDLMNLKNKVSKIKKRFFLK